MLSTGKSRVVQNYLGIWVVQHQVLHEGKCGDTNPQDRLIWVRAYTVQQALSPTFSRINNR
jgi:hypothetical protein